MIKSNDQDEVICAGFYAAKNGSSADGTYFARYTSDRLTKKSTETDEFSVDFIVDGKSNRVERKAVRKDSKGKTVELPHLKVRDFVLRSDGGILLIGEEYYVEEDSKGNTECNYNDIMVININSKGTMDWAKKIYKRQELFLSDTSPLGAMYALVAPIPGQLLIQGTKASLIAVQDVIDNFGCTPFYTDSQGSAHVSI